MADQILDKARDIAEGQIDFEGQRFAEFLATALLSLFGVIAFVAGHIKQDIKLALVTGLLGTAFTMALVVPPWPFFNRHPIKWLPVGGVAKDSQGITVDGQVVG
ncbi:hypothetical protein GLAREA_01074 [Glarea lozoyensis ATCC 20868]|uniref:Signal peptidase complex subunit 1 n=1 Tax=Glarea lozoyensis (strain ATCC 20868 / MF5171) TaxID=1116229 RepID=S3CY82_GLAL2|nr:uncharacterized protein GLAREA_01074 [Glarea lozoyensis ATCC 20868]EPE29914.1 hypothetical protein GLAREA_01074 [Glarea lozoyensis ATCC 20868]